MFTATMNYNLHFHTHPYTDKLTQEDMHYQSLGKVQTRSQHVTSTDKTDFSCLQERQTDYAFNYASGNESLYSKVKDL